MTPTQIAVAIAVGVGPTALLLALFGWLVWLDRPARVTRQQPPAPVVVPDDLTALADVLIVDPPTTRLYVASECPELWQDEVGCDKPGPHRCVVKDEHAIHMCPCGSLVVDDLVQVGTAMVHRGCRDVRRDRGIEAVRACCRLNLDKVTVAKW